MSVKKIGDKTVKRIIFFASGSGTNVENIIKYFHGNKAVEITLILTNNPNAGVVRRAKKMKKPLMLFSKRELLDQSLLRKITTINPDLIILAGFLLKIPKEFIKAFPKKIINIHPAILPKFGGEGMYGNRIHQSVKDAGEQKTGITIHFVNEYFDQGEIIFQASVNVECDDSVEEIADKVHQLEYAHYPRLINKLLFY
tara:strand:+ start:179 stop:772 length:594 start_codon:yes stop_codon:yes gene_type:complete